MTTWPSSPYRHGIRRQIPDTSDPTLVGAWGGKIIGGVLPDVSGNGNNGIPDMVSGECTILGDALRYRSLDSSRVTFGAVSFEYADVTLEFWMTTDQLVANAWLINYYKDASDGWGIRVSSGGDLEIYDDIDNAGSAIYATPLLAGRLYHVVAVMDSLENKLYLDGQLVGSGTSSSDNWASFGASGRLYFGYRGVANYHDGLILPVSLYDEAKDADWVAAQYAIGAPAVQFGTDWGCFTSLANET